MPHLIVLLKVCLKLFNKAFVLLSGTSAFKIELVNCVKACCPFTPNEDKEVAIY
jgi:hypothetical protein